MARGGQDARQHRAVPQVQVPVVRAASGSASRSCASSFSPVSLRGTTRDAIDAAPRSGKGLGVGDAVSGFRRNARGGRVTRAALNPAPWPGVCLKSPPPRHGRPWRRVWVVSLARGVAPRSPEPIQSGQPAGARPEELREECPPTPSCPCSPPACRTTRCRAPSTPTRASSISISPRSGKDWLFAIPSCEIPKTGNFVTLQVGVYPVVIVRGADGADPRLPQLLPPPRQPGLPGAEGQSAPKLVCPYHQWTYELDGRLLFARDMGADFDAAEHGLKPVALPRRRAAWSSSASPRRPAGLRRRSAETARALPRAAPADEAKVAFESHHRREGQLEARDGEQPRVLPLRGQPSRRCAAPSPTTRGYTSMDGDGTVEPVIDEHGRSARRRDCRRASTSTRRPPVALRAHPAARRGRELHDGRQGGGADEPLGPRRSTDAGTLLFFHYPNTWNHFLGDHAIDLPHPADQRRPRPR